MSAELPIAVVRGTPTDEELAALVVALLGVASAGSSTSQPAPAPGRWADPRARLRPTYGLGPGGWRASALPG